MVRVRGSVGEVVGCVFVRAGEVERAVRMGLMCWWWESVSGDAFIGGSCGNSMLIQIRDEYLESFHRAGPQHILCDPKCGTPGTQTKKHRK